MHHNSAPFSRLYALLRLAPVLLIGLVPALVIGVVSAQVRTLHTMPQFRSGSSEPELPSSLTQGQMDGTLRNRLKQMMEKHNAS